MKESPGEPNAGPVRISVLAVLVLLLLVGGVAIYSFRKHPAPSPPPAAPEPNSQPTELHTAPRPAPPVEVASAPVPAVPPSPAVQQPAGSEGSPQSRQLIANITQLGLTNGPLTQEKLFAWQQAVQQLVNSGADAIPAIRAFLQSKADANFESIGGSAIMGSPSLRLGLLDALSKIGGSDALQLTFETLQSTTDPREIAILARTLEQQAPGQYSEAAAQAARAALAQAAAGKLGDTDVGILFNVLQQYGGAMAADDFQAAKGKWTYYSVIALASLPDAAGIPALVQMAQETTGNSRTARSAALQALAQLAPSSMDAQAALLEQARDAQLPAATWIKIASLLGGEQMQITGPADMGAVPPQDPKKSTYHLSGGNQNFHTTSVLDRLNPDQISQRIQLIDQLFSVNPNAAGVDSLQRARATLAARLPSGSK